MAQKPLDAVSSNGEAQEGRLSALIHCSLEARSLLSSHFEFLPDKVQEGLQSDSGANTHSFSSSPPATFRFSR